MKKNIDYYPHKTEAHRHPKFKMLRSLYGNSTEGWAAEGRFWALNNLIASAEDCKLDLTKKRNKGVFADELGMSIAEFEDFLKVLISEDVELLTEIETDIYTTETVQDTYSTISQDRETARERKTKSSKNSGSAGNDKSSDELFNSSTELNNKVNKSKVNEIKLNKIKVNESGDFLFLNDFLKKLYSDHTKIKNPNQEMHLDPLLEFFTKIPEVMTQNDITECMEESFKTLNQNINLRVDFLCINIQNKINDRLERIQNADKKSVLKEASIFRIEQEKLEKEQNRKNDLEKLAGMKEFYEKNSTMFTEREKADLVQYFNNNQIISAASIIEPKMEEVAFG